MSLIANKTMKTAFILWGLSFISIILLFASDPSLYTAAIVILLLVIIHHEILNGIIHSKEIKLLKQLEKYLSDVRHSYYINHMVEESIEEATEHCGHEMKIHAIKLYDILTSDDTEEDIHKYQNTVPNKFLRLFLSLCITVMEYGDQEVSGQSLFLDNIKILKNDIHIELLKLSDTKFRFSGLTFIAVIPVFFLQLIKDWSISNLPELKIFYESSTGVVLGVFIYIFTLISYSMINHLKEIKSIVPKDHFILDKFVHIPWLNHLLENYIEKHYGKILYIKELLKKAGDNITVKQFILQRLLFQVITFLISISIFNGLHINNHVGHLMWQEVLLSWFLSHIAYYFPLWMILYKRKIATLNMDDEIIQFQSIIMMLMYMDRMSVLNILEFMESFAVIFKDSIQDCINDYNSGDIQALEELREKEAYEPFKRLVDSLIICDRIGIEKAFDEISTDRLYYQDKRKQDNEISLSKKVVVGKLIAYVPLMITVGFYLILPFIIESLNQLKGYADEWNML